MQRQLAQQQIEFLPLDDTLWQDQVSAAQPQFEVDGELAVVLFPPEAQKLATRPIVQRRRPVERCRKCLELAGAHAARIQTTDGGAHAGTGDDVDRDALLFEYLQHTDMRGAARPAAAQYQANAQPLAGAR